PAASVVSASRVRGALAPAVVGATAHRLADRACAPPARRALRRLHAPALDARRCDGTGRRSGTLRPSRAGARVLPESRVLERSGTVLRDAADSARGARDRGQAAPGR